MKKIFKLNNQKGQALVLLLVFVAIAMIVTTSAVTLTIVNTQSTSRLSLGKQALSLAQSGLDNAILRLLRDPAYNGETITIGSGSVTITVTGITTRTITSVGSLTDYQRTIRVVGSYVNNIFTITSYQEVGS